jgi:hypothetical protein
MENIKKVRRGLWNEGGKDIVFPSYCFIGGKEKRKKQESKDKILPLYPDSNGLKPV